MHLYRLELIWTFAIFFCVLQEITSYQILWVNGNHALFDSWIPIHVFKACIWWRLRMNVNGATKIGGYCLPSKWRKALVTLRRVKSRWNCGPIDYLFCLVSILYMSASPTCVAIPTHQPCFSFDADGNVLECDW
jgi:hypothetical protein